MLPYSIHEIVIAKRNFHAYFGNIYDPNFIVSAKVPKLKRKVNDLFRKMVKKQGREYRALKSEIDFYC